MIEAVGASEAQSVQDGGNARDKIAVSLKSSEQIP
jgi:hypothetical protein